MRYSYSIYYDYNHVNPPAKKYCRLWGGNIIMVGYFL